MILKKTSYSIGKIYEQHALNYLESLQWHIITRNYKNSYGEIDILATYNSTLVGCEVKARKNNNYLFYSVKRTQQLRITNSLIYFLTENPKYANYTIRFDVILVEILNNKITHIENAWEINEEP